MNEISIYTIVQDPFIEQVVEGTNLLKRVQATK